MGTNYKHLSCEERTLIQLSLEQGCTLRVIARSLQRAPSSISRELKRNGWTNPTTGPRKRGRPPLAGGYRAPLAQQRATGLAATARYPSRLAQDGPLWGYVARLLRDRHSPEQISRILCRMQPDDPTLQVSHETIYTALYAMPCGELRTELIACLRQARKSRQSRARGADRRGTIPNMVSIHMRPPEIEGRVMPGHWEGDLIKGARNATAANLHIVFGQEPGHYKPPLRAGDNVFLQRARIAQAAALVDPATLARHQRHHGRNGVGEAHLLHQVQDGVVDSLDFRLG